MDCQFCLTAFLSLVQKMFLAIRLWCGLSYVLQLHLWSAFWNWLYWGHGCYFQSYSYVLTLTILSFRPQLVAQLRLQFDLLFSCTPWMAELRPQFDRNLFLSPMSESCRRHGCLSLLSIVCFQVQVSVSGWSLIQRSPECDREASTMRGPCHT
jgi:hypothetical protein